MTLTLPSPFTIAIDGPAAAGKGTISRAVAAELGVAHLDTGLLYRAVAARVIRGEKGLDAALSLRAEDITSSGLRSRDVSDVASRVAADPEIRSALLDFQHAFARRSGGAVLDGRDIGTVICPQAEAKLFVTATDEVRAARRHAELTASGAKLTIGDVIEDLRIRDNRDASRTDAPMRKADEALLLDTSQLSIEDATKAALKHIRRCAKRTVSQHF